MDRGKEPINQPSNKGKLWNGKLIRRLLLTMIVPDLERFTHKGKRVTYTRAFVELYNWRNGRQVYEIHRMIELKKICSLTVKNPHDLGAHQIIEISSVLHSAHVIPKNQDKFVFYVNSYIN